LPRAIRTKSGSQNCVARPVALCSPRLRLKSPEEIRREIRREYGSQFFTLLSIFKLRSPRPTFLSFDSPHVGVSPLTCHHPVTAAARRTRCKTARAPIMGGPRNRAAEKKAAGVPWRPPWVALARTKTETGVRFKSNGARVPWKRSTKISRLHELIRRGGATKLANVNGCPIIAAAAQRTTECLAKGGKAAKSYPQKELALQEWECWLLYERPSINYKKFQIPFCPPYLVRVVLR